MTYPGAVAFARKNLQAAQANLNVFIRRNGIEDDYDLQPEIARELDRLKERVRIRESESEAVNRASKRSVVFR